MCNDLPKYVDNSWDYVTLNDPLIHCLIFADGLILLSSTSIGLQSKLDI